MPEGPGSDEPFTYKTENGSITVPALGRMPIGLMRRTRHLAEQDQMFTLLEELLDDDALAVFDQMGSADAEMFFVKWQEHSGVSVGESQAS